MNKLTLIKDLKQPDWLEATWVEEVITTSLVQNEVDGEIVEETVDNTETTILHCESYSGHKEHIQMLENKCMEFDTTLNEEQKSIIKEVSKAFVYPDENELAKEIELQRILSIKSKAGEIISSKYSIVWQLNHPRSDEAYKLDYEWIDSIRTISNKAELDGTALDDINWGI